jgi:hypothetical protein
MSDPGTHTSTDGAAESSTSPTDPASACTVRS